MAKLSGSSQPAEVILQELLRRQRKARRVVSELGDLERTLGCRFTNSGLLEQALTHGSVRHEQQLGEERAIQSSVEDNERLEFLGDAIVGMVIAELLYRRYPELHEGELTRLRAALVSRKHLGVVGTGLGLGSYLRLGKAEERNGGRRKAVLLANCMEALIGAVFLEGGFAAAAAFVERSVAEPYLADLRDELREHSAIGDYKTALQELLQARRAGQPEYAVVAESGPDHRKRFLVEVRIRSGGQERAQAESSTKKKAEQEAARELYELLSSRARAESGLHKPAAAAVDPLPSSASPSEGLLHAAGIGLASARNSVGLRPKKAKKSQAFRVVHTVSTGTALLASPPLERGDVYPARRQPSGAGRKRGATKKMGAIGMRNSGDRSLGN